LLPSVMLGLSYLLVPLLFLCQTSISQSTGCTYSCPSTDNLGQALLERPLAIPYQSDYSIFECVYVQVYRVCPLLTSSCRYGGVIPNSQTRSCFYTKVHGGDASAAKFLLTPFLVRRKTNARWSREPMSSPSASLLR
jgi:hypothetical protein